MHKMIFNNMSLHTAGAPEIWIDQWGFSRLEKLYCPDVIVSKELKSGNFLTGDFYFFIFFIFYLFIYFFWHKCDFI